MHGGPPDLSSLPGHVHLHGEAETFVENILDTHVHTKNNLEASVVKYKAATDAHHRRLVFDSGDLVWAVLTRDRMPSTTNSKLRRSVLLKYSNALTTMLIAFAYLQYQYF